MYSFKNRLNALFFFTLLMLTLLSIGNVLTTIFAEKDVQVDFQFSHTETFRVDRVINEDKGILVFSLRTNLTSLFDWNTNLIFAWLTCEYESPKSAYNRVTVWDKIVKREFKNEQLIDLQSETVEYPISDVYKKLKGRKVNVFFNWEHMPIVGINYKGRKHVGEFTMPSEYT